MRMYYFFIPIIIYWFIICQSLSSEDNNEYRLPSTLTPNEYNITLHPHFDLFTFSGNEIISISISPDHWNNKEDSDNFMIEINKGDQLDISYGCLLSLSLTAHTCDYELLSQSFDNYTQIVSLYFNASNSVIKDQTDSNDLHLYLVFSGKLRFDMKGFYISQYLYANTMIYNAVTQFESTDARRAFPSFDEPSFKARFGITMIAPSDCTVLSNMDVQSIDYNLNNSYHDENDTESGCYYQYPPDVTVKTDCKKVVFNISPAMSSYLVAFVVGLYDNVSTIMESNNKPISVYYPLDTPDGHADYALDIAARILPYYETLFNVPYPLPKMDLMALSDFASGAMENWGLVTYRRTALLVDESTSSESALQRVVVVIAHEFAHQWFGDIVTMDWWDDLWLNEGFASFVEYIGTNHSEPKFNIWNTFKIYLNDVLFVDSSDYTHPIQQSVSDPNEIDTLFDSVTYNKGSSIIFMLYQFMGHSLFMSGIEDYLKEYQYSNANTQELWTSLDSVYSDSTGSDDSAITDLMDSWVLQSGFPLVNVSIISMKSNEIKFFVEQTRMKSNAFPSNTNDNMTVGNDNGQLWHIPLQIVSASSSWDYDNNNIYLSNNVMEARNDTYTIAVSGEKDAYLFNKNMNGFFRVFYDSKSMSLIVSNWDALSDFDRFAILSDYFAFMLNGLITCAEYLEFIESRLLNETSYLIWDLVVDSLITVDSLFCELYVVDVDDSLGLRDDYRAFANALLMPIWSHINEWNIGDTFVDSEDTIHLRSILINALVRFNNADVIDYGYALLYSYNMGSNEDQIYVDSNGQIGGIDSNIMRSVLECSIAKRNVSILTELQSIYNDLNSEYQQYVLRAIGAIYFHSEGHKDAMEFVLSRGDVRDQDKMRAMYSLNRCFGRQSLWKYLTKTNNAIDGDSIWMELFVKYGSGFALSDLTELPKTFSSPEYYELVKEWYDDGVHVTSANVRSANQTLENIGNNIVWLDANVNGVKLFLNKTNGNGGGNGHGGDSSLVWIVAVFVILFLVAFVLIVKWMRDNKCKGGVCQKWKSNQKLVAYQRQVNDQEILRTNVVNIASIDDYDDDHQNTHFNQHHRDDQLL